MKVAQIAGILVLLCLCQLFSVYFHYSSSWCARDNNQQENGDNTDQFVHRSRAAAVNRQRPRAHQPAVELEPLDDELSFHEYRKERFRELVNKDTYLFWNIFYYKRFMDELAPDYDDLTPNVGEQLIWVTEKEKLRVWRSPTPRIIRQDVLCDAIRFFCQTDQIKPHVLLCSLGENWGSFSTHVPNRTTNWGTFDFNLEKHGCSREDVFDYLDHPNVLAVITAQHHVFDHPKVHSVPLGVKHDASLLMERIQHEINVPTITEDRPNLLMVNDGPKLLRPLIAKRIIQNFHGTIQNTYGRNENITDYFDEMIQSKFILSPPGLGWDCYRHWEALYLGTIPILETYYRSDGFYRVFDGLPVLWVNHLHQVTPALLEREYPKILRRWKTFQYEKLTIPYWVDFVHSFLREYDGSTKKTD